MEIVQNIENYEKEIDAAILRNTQKQQKKLARCSSKTTRSEENKSARSANIGSPVTKVESTVNQKYKVKIKVPYTETERTELPSGEIIIRQITKYKIKTAELWKIPVLEQEKQQRKQQVIAQVSQRQKQQYLASKQQHEIKEPKPSLVQLEKEHQDIAHLIRSVTQITELKEIKSQIKQLNKEREQQYSILRGQIRSINNKRKEDLYKEFEERIKMKNMGVKQQIEYKNSKLQYKKELAQWDNMVRKTQYNQKSFISKIFSNKDSQEIKQADQFISKLNRQSVVNNALQIEIMKLEDKIRKDEEYLKVMKQYKQEIDKEDIVEIKRKIEKNKELIKQCINKMY